MHATSPERRTQESRPPCRHILGFNALVKKLADQSQQPVQIVSRKTCDCRCAEEHQLLCLDPYDDAA